MTRTVALIGYGAIARQVCATVAQDESLPIRQILLRPGSTSRLPLGIESISSLAQLSPDVDFVLECAGHAAVVEHAANCLARGIDFGLLSAGALADQSLSDRLMAASGSSGAQLIVIPGAIGGMDALAAAGPSLDRVAYTARKPPLSWSGTPAEKACNLTDIRAATPVFEGSAREAALSYPKNANVVATVALAGIGFDRTEVTLLADPDAGGNSHHVAASGNLVNLDYTTRSAALPDNPKTSALTAMSAVRALKHRIGWIIV